MLSGPMYDLRVLDIRTRLVHAATLDKVGHYDYDYELACETRVKREELFQSKDPMLSCLGCLAVCG